MIYEMIDMNEWRTKRNILCELRLKGLDMDERTWRKTVERINKLFYEHEIDTFIAHSDKGYKATKDDKEIKRSALDYKKRAIDQLVKYSRICKAIGENINFKLELDENHLMILDEEGL